MIRTPASFIPLLAPHPGAKTHTFLFRRDELLVGEADLALAGEQECRALGIDAAAIHPVGLMNGSYYRTAWVAPDCEPPAGFTFRKLRALFGVLDDAIAAVAGRASQIAEWARTHRYCGACAAAMVLVPGERCLKCPACGMSAYPRISPAMMVLVKRGDAILLARNAAWPANRFSALAGFLEPGESVEEAVHREVREEVGLAVHELKYFGSQSWPFPHSLMIAFTAEYLSGELKVDGNEIAEARWIGAGDTLPDLPTGISISSALIRANLPHGAGTAA